MPTFDELIQQARDGDLSALDSLEQEFSGSTLRQKAEEGERFKALAEKAMPALRRSRIEELTDKLPENLREFASVEDFADADPDSITLESLNEKASQRSQSEESRRLATAQEAGFESWEEFRTAMDAVKQQKTQRRTDMEAVGGAAASGGSDVDILDADLFDAGKEAFESTKKDGRSDDVAMANAVDAILGKQLQELDLEG